MPETDTLEEANLRKVELETGKLAAEIQKLQDETIAVRSAHLRGWIVSLSIVAGIGVSVVGIYKSLTEIAFNNRQLGLETQVRSHEIFLNQVLDRMSGIKVIHQELNDDGQMVPKTRDSYGDVIQVGAYGSAVSLACRFEDLRLPALSALTAQLAMQPTDLGAEAMLRRIEQGCPMGWDRLTDQEKTAWFGRTKP
jgi:hypothetical protein